MATIVIELDPAELENPDLDLRYLVPDLLIARCEGMFADAGYDYSGDPDCQKLLIYLSTSDPKRSVASIREVLAAERPLGNDLSGVLIRTEEEPA